MAIVIRSLCFEDYYLTPSVRVQVCCIAIELGLFWEPSLGMFLAASLNVSPSRANLSRWFFMAVHFLIRLFERLRKQFSLAQATIAPN
jgi:hypothetical protein